MCITRFRRCLLPLLALAATLPTAVSQAQTLPRRQSHVYAQLAVGPGYMTNFTREPKNGYSPNDHAAPGVALQVEVGARIVRQLSLQVLQLVDFGMPERSGLTPLFRWGFGLGATLHLYGAQLMLGGGAHLTDYMNYVDDPSIGMGADLGPFAAASLGYAFRYDPGLTFGVHAFGRYYSATDDYMGTHYDPYGYSLGAVISVGFLGRPFLGT